MAVVRALIAPFTSLLARATRSWLIARAKAGGDLVRWVHGDVSALPALTHLQLRLSNMGDKGVKEIVDSGILKRLKVLDLRHGCITDKGAKLFAGCPDLKNLELLDLGRNALTQEGIEALQATGVKVKVGNQHSADSDEYLYDGDIE